jgi:hypothetical protein
MIEYFTAQNNSDRFLLICLRKRDSYIPDLIKRDYNKEKLSSQ